MNGEVTQTPVEIWRDQVGSRLQRIAENSVGTLIMLVPSIRDLISQHIAYPQAKLDKELLSLPKVCRAFTTIQHAYH